MKEYLKKKPIFWILLLGILLTLPLVPALGTYSRLTHTRYRVAPDISLGPPEYPIFEHGSMNPTRLSQSAQLFDRDTPYYDNAELTVTITENNSIDDRLVLIQDYTLKIIDNIIEKDIRVNGVNVATLEGGDGFNPLVVTFNRYSNHNAVKTVLDHIGYLNLSKKSLQGYRKISYVLTNGEGGSSREVIKTLILK